MSTDAKWNVNSWRGLVGSVLPSTRFSAHELAETLPDGVGMISRYMDPRQGTVSEFRDYLPEVEQHIDDLAKLGVDLVYQIGIPYMLVHGFNRAEELVAKWEQRYRVPVLTTAGLQVRAMRAMQIQRFVGLSYLGEGNELNKLAVQFFSDAGFEVAAMESVGTFDQAHHIPAPQIYKSAKALFLRHEPVDGIYLLGGAWQVREAIEPLEQDLETIVIGGRGDDSWAIQRRIRVNQVRTGLGRLHTEFPPWPG